jgi:CUB/sushi domain-containing protein
LLVVATVMGCAYPELKTGAGGTHAAAGTQATGGTYAGGSAAGATGTSSGGKGGNAAGATGTSSSGKGGSAAGATGMSSSGGKGGSAAGATSSSGKGGNSGSSDAGVGDAPGSQPDVPAGGTGGGGTSTSGTSSTGGSSESSSGAGPNCPALTSPANGSVSVPDASPGSTAVYYCDPGYNLSGSMTRTCQPDGTWNVPEPSCAILDCGALTDPANGSVSASPTTYGSTADYTCNLGYGLLGTSPRTCQADGTWSGTAPTCSPADCATAPSPANGVVTTTGTTFGSTATYSCDPGYDLSSTDARTCQADGTWSGTTPTCASVECGSPPGLGYTGSVSVTGTTYGSTATYTCNLGYSMTGAKTRTCQADGTWSGITPACTVVDCGSPPDTANGSFTITGTTYNATATYTCKTGYSLSGFSMRTCQADGTWSTPAPLCSVMMLTLTVGKSGYGKGTVSSSAGDISCGVACAGTAASYAYGTNIILTATADTGTSQQFIGWTSTPNFTSCTQKLTPSCSFALTQDTTLTADFSPPPNYMFTTSTLQGPGSLGGLAGADALCATLAANAYLSGKYVAWLSSTTVSAPSRLGNASGWIRTDGKPVLNYVTDIVNNKFFYPPRLDELGRDLGVDPVVMTSTNPDGTPATSNPYYGTCGDFTSIVDDGHLVEGGFASANSYKFTMYAYIGCSQSVRLYCFGVDRQAQLVVTPAVGRYAFVTKQPWLPSGGISSADAVCQQDATAANLPGTYKAMLAQTGYQRSAASRFNLNGLPWIRPDGILLAPTAAVFFSTTLLDATPNMTADGSVHYSHNGAWTGATGGMIDGTDATDCTSWTSTIGKASAGPVDDTSTASYFNYWPADQTFGYSCDFTNMLLTCLQDS